MKQTNYVERLNRILTEYKDSDINDYTYLYSSFKSKKTNKFNYIYKERLLPLLKAQFNKRAKKDDFDKKLFSKILFNNLYYIRQDNDDLIPYYLKDKKEDEMYIYYASHQRIRKELEHLSIDEIMRFAWELVKHFRRNNKEK